MIKRIFFDVGSVLFNDDPQNFQAYRWYYEEIRRVYPEYSFADMMSEREELCRDGARWVLHEIARRYLSKERVGEIHQAATKWLAERYDEHHLLNDGVPDVVLRLARKRKLGVIANQPAECRRSLQRRGMLDLFDVVAISDELDLHKPDVELYRWALAECDELPHECLMVGDRLDNDVLPAKQAGMQAVWLRSKGSHTRGWRPSDPMARMFLQSCDALPIFSRGVQTAEEADAVIDSLHALEECL